MAQIIKHRRGSIASVKGSSSRKGELIIATGSINDLQGPFVFIGNDDGQGLYNSVSKIYAGASAPTLSNLTYGSVLDGTPFYSTDDQALYILNNTGNGGNVKVDLTGNLEGNTVSGMTITNLSGTTATFDQINLSTIAFTGLTEGRVTLVGPGGSLIDSGSLTMNNGQLGLSGSIKLNNDAYIYNDGQLYVEDNTNGVIIHSNNYAELQSGNAYMWVENGTASIEANIVDIYSQDGPLYLTNNTTNGTLEIKSRNGGTTLINNETNNNVGDVHILSGEGNQLYISGNTHMTSTVYIDETAAMYHDGAFFIEDNTNGVELLSNGNYLEIQNSGNGHWYQSGQVEIEANNGQLLLKSNNNNVWISSFDGNILHLNNDGGEGNIQIGNNGNSLYSNTVVSQLNGSSYAELHTADSYIWTDSEGAYLQQDLNGLAGVTARPNSLVEITGSLNVDNGGLVYNGDTFQLGGGAFEVDLATGNVRTTGSITMKGNITIGDNQSQDIINLNAEISSSLVPSGSNLFDLGSSTNYWHDLFVSGTAHISVLDAGSISLSGITVFNDLQVSGSIYNYTLSSNDVVFVDGDQRLTGSADFQYNASTGYLTAPFINATNDGNGTNFLIGNDMWLGDINESNATRFMGASDNNVAKIYLGTDNTNNYLESNYSNTTLSSENNLYLQSQNSQVRIDAHGGNLRLNTSSNNNVQIGGNTYIYDNYNLYTSTIWDNTDGDNYIKVFGTQNSGWWTSNTGADLEIGGTYNSANVNILQTNNGKVNIDAPEVNIHTNNGFNVTGSMIVSDGSGVFNSSLVTNNSNLTLTNGSNLDIQNNGTLTVDGNADFHNNVYITGNTYSDSYRGLNDNNSGLFLNYNSTGGDNYQVELWSNNGDVSIYSDNGRIHLTGSVYASSNIQIDNGNTLKTNYIYDNNDNGLSIGASADLHLYSDNNRNVYLSSNNAEGGTNYLWVQNNGVGFQTYDYTSDLNHNVYLDNTGSLKLTNVDLLISGSLGVNGNTTFNNDLTVDGNMYVSGNFTVLGTGSIINLTGSQIDIGTNKIVLNTYAPFERFAGIDVYDSGSNAGVTGSLLWDSLNNVWIYANPSGSAYASARFIAGPMNTGSLGQETGLTNGHFPIAVADDHIADSLLTYQGTTLALNTNKFTVDSTSGDTVILGNFTLQGVGGTDNGGATSYVVFRNSDDVLGFVDTADTQNVLDHMLGYNTTTGNLEFSSVIDGGSF